MGKSVKGRGAANFEEPLKTNLEEFVFQDVRE
jgi:hypothetical protein